MVNCSGSSTGAASADLARGMGEGGGGAAGLGTATARGGVTAARASGVSEGFAEIFFFGLGELDGLFPGVALFFFFFPFSDGSFVGDFFALGFGVASGVSLGLGDSSDSSAGVFFGFAFFFGDGEADAAFFFLMGDVFSFGVAVGVFSLAPESTARALRIGFPSSVVCCA